MKKRIYVLSVILIIILLMTGCANSKTANEFIDISKSVNSDVGIQKTDNVDVTVFFQDTNGYIVPVKTNIAWTEGIAKAVIRKMMNTSELQRELVVMGLESLMPPEAAINGIDITNGLAKIDFTTSKLTFNSVKSEKNFVQGVVLALTSFPTVKEVQFMFNGHVIDALPNGTAVGMPIKAEDINFAGSTTVGEAVSVYYHGTSTTNFEYYVPVTVYMEDANCFSALNYLVTHDCKDLKTCIPEGTKLLSVKTIENTLCLYFSDEFNRLKDSPAEEAFAIKSIALTCSNFDNLRRIKIYAGSKEYVPSEGIDTPSFANIY